MSSKIRSSRWAWQNRDKMWKRSLTAWTTMDRTASSFKSSSTSSRRVTLKVTNPWLSDSSNVTFFKSILKPLIVDIELIENKIEGISKEEQQALQFQNIISIVRRKKLWNYWREKGEKQQEGENVLRAYEKYQNQARRKRKTKKKKQWEWWIYPLYNTVDYIVCSVHHRTSINHWSESFSSMDWKECIMKPTISVSSLYPSNCWTSQHSIRIMRLESLSCHIII